jgi:tetratricopeptide (TPR) repeat protein
VADTQRLEDLRRRVEKDPASLVFAQLAEEYRRAGQYDDAIRTCCDGLIHHPSYLSARVTLGRALMAVGDIDAAEHELRAVLETAPENLAALRSLADIHQQRGNIAAALTEYRAAQALAPDDLDLARAIAAAQDRIGGESIDPAHGAAHAGPGPGAQHLGPTPGAPHPEPAAAAEPASPIAALENWLAAIQNDRASRRERA